MALLCVFGIHKWQGCKCLRCNRTRDEQHDWHGCKCSSCGMKRDEAHTWDGCKCSSCGMKRDEAHAWDGCICTVCGKKRAEGHTIANHKCTRCGYIEAHEHVYKNGHCTVCGAADARRLMDTAHGKAVEWWASAGSAKSRVRGYAICDGLDCGRHIPPGEGYLRESFLKDVMGLDSPPEIVCEKCARGRL